MIEPAPSFQLRAGPRILGALGLALAVIALFHRLAAAAPSGLDQWITSDTLYPVHVTIDVVRDGFGFDGWKFSIAPCWFPDLFLCGILWLITRSAVVATLLAGVAQLPLIMLAFDAFQKACGTRSRAAIASVLATATVIVVALKARSGYSGMELNRFVLPQSHVGGLVNSLLALGLGLWFVRRELEGRRRLWLGIWLAALCLLAAASNLMFFAQALVPLTGALVVGALLGRIAWGHAWPVLAIGWPPALIGEFLDRHALATTSLIAQARFSVPRVRTAAVVFWEGFSGQVRSGEPLHWLALGWLATTAVLLVRARARAARSTGPAATNATGEFLMHLSLVFSAIASCAANILGGNTGLVDARDYSWVTHYLQAVFFTPIFAIPFAIALVVEARMSPRLRSGFAWAIAALTAGTGAIAVAAQPVAPAPLRDFRPPLVEFIDRFAAGRDLRVGLAGYWQARPITLLSHMGVRANPVDRSFKPFLWVSNRHWYFERAGNHREPPPVDFVILDDPIWKQSREDAVAKFGPPVEEVSFRGTRILIYKRSATP